MWEVATGRLPYAGLMYGEVVERVVVSHRRPAFPPYVPQPYVALAQGCWAASPTERPTFGQVRVCVFCDADTCRLLHASVPGLAPLCAEKRSLQGMLWSRPLVYVVL